MNRIFVRGICARRVDVIRRSANKDSTRGFGLRVTRYRHFDGQHMKISATNRRLLYCCLLVLGICLCGNAQAASGEDEIDLMMGSTGGVYFLAEPGELIVVVEKRDRHLRNVRTDLRAIFVGPDRGVIEDVTIPDDGLDKGSGLGPSERVELKAQVDRPGIYALNITVSNDRYGDAILWGFRTNCAHYLIETARGHRDERRQEPIVLMNPDKPGNVCFLPRKGAFGVEITGLPKDITSLPVYDGAGALVETLQAKEGNVSFTFPADIHRDAVPWRLHLPKQHAVIQIDGVTRWDENDLYPNLPMWTSDPVAFFPFHEYRWILTPYSRTVYGTPDEEKQVAFQVHNNADAMRNIKLGIEFPATTWPVRLSTERVTLKPKESTEVSVTCTVPEEGNSRVCYLRATPVEDPDFSTYSTLRVIGGVAPATQPLPKPYILKPYRHENEQFGYLPDYPVGQEMYFDLENQPWVVTGSGVSTLRDGQWVRCETVDAIKSFRPVSKVAFDSDNGVYLIGTASGQATLLHSADAGKSFAAYPFAKPGALDIEQFSGHNVPDGPPPILRSIQTAADPKRIWRRFCNLELFVPKMKDGKIVVGDPIPVSKESLGVGTHSGHASAVVSRDNKVHIIWAEATDPEEKVPGVPTYVASYDKDTATLGKPVLIGYGAPPNDVHNRPSITMDSKGYLHALTGTHGQPFYYARSLKPNDADSGWTEAEPVGDGLRQTYIGLVCGTDDTLHLVFRYWRHDPEYHPSGALFATLAYQSKRPGQPWGPPRVLIVSPFSEYSIFYHRLTIDRTGRLFLSYDYWSTYWSYRTDHFGRRRALMMSPDAGNTWKLVQTPALLP